MKINEKIRQLRTKSEISKESMAKYLDVDQSYISKLESSEKEENIEIDLLEKLSELFICNLYDLIDESKSVTAMSIPCRKKIYSVSDLENIGRANSIILNLKEMVDLSE